MSAVDIDCPDKDSIHGVFLLIYLSFYRSKRIGASPKRPAPTRGEQPPAQFSLPFKKNDPPHQGVVSVGLPLCVP